MDIKIGETAATLRDIADHIKATRTIWPITPVQDEIANDLGRYVMEHAFDLISALRLYADTLPQPIPVIIARHPSELKVGDWVYDPNEHANTQVTVVGPDSHAGFEGMTRIQFDNGSGWTFLPGGRYDNILWKVAPEAG